MRLAALVLSSAALAVAQPNAATEALARLQQKTANLPPALALDFRMLAAQSLHKTQPELSSRLVQQTLDELRRSKDLKPGRASVRVLADLAPRDAAAALPLESRADLVGAALNARRPVEAAALFRELLLKEAAPLALAAPLIGQLARENKDDALRLFIEVTGAIDADSAPTDQAWRLLEAANAIAPIAPPNAAAAAESLLKAASSPDYGQPGAVDVVARFGPSQPPVSASNTRESILMGAGAILARTAPAKLALYQSVLSKWPNLATLRPVSVNFRVAGQTPQPPNPALAAISQRLGPYRSLPTDADRAKLALEVVAEIEKLPPTDQFGPARSLSHVITEGDMGKPALTAVTRAYAKGILAAKDRAGIDDWTHLASLIRYERLEAPVTDPALDAAMALLDVRESILQDASFSLTGIDGKTYSLAALRGKVVLVNFWATWCPPCRKEMPDMEKLYREFGGKGFVVLAVSDEDRETVEGYLAKQKYTFPVLLDPGRKVHTAFDVDGIPKSFLFDRSGKLAGQTIDMRTESQFREMLKSVGLE
jgi:peroxiredoxin